MDDARLLETARRSLRQQAEAIAALAERLGPEIAAAARLLLGCAGKVAVSGMGKSGLIGRKVAATLASTGTPAFFLHPAEALHGDAGAVTRGDAALLLSRSGETAELLQLLPSFRQKGVPVVAIVGAMGSTLARRADAALDACVAAEACPLDLAPTTSATAALVIGDALAIALMEARGLTAEGFAASHPGGLLGRRLLYTVADAMQRADLPLVGAQSALREAIPAMSRGRLGLAVVLDAGSIVGIVTDGDLRRALERQAPLDEPVAAVMTRSPRWCPPGMLAAEAHARMTAERITALLVSEDGQALEGVVHIHHLGAALGI